MPCLLLGTLFPYSSEIHDLGFCIESFYRHTKSGIKNIGLNISFAAKAATCNIHIVLECMCTGELGAQKGCCLLCMSEWKEQEELRPEGLWHKLTALETEMTFHDMIL